MTRLLEILESAENQVRTRTLNISLNELADMVDGGELKINPDYQRLFQWSTGAQSRFIESLVLEMPIPPIFVVEEEENRYSLIDGLQRLSSYLHFRGQLNAPDLENPINKGDYLTLIDCDIIEDLNGFTWKQLPTALQIRLKRSFMSVEVVRRGNDPKLKYYMFKRLNTGGVALGPQQIRNSTVRILSPVFLDFIDELMKNEDFLNTVSLLAKEKKNAMYREELILRFFAMKNKTNDFKHDIEEFLTNYIESVSDPLTEEAFDYEAEKIKFEKTFALLNKLYGDRVFSQFNTKTRNFTAFSVLHFEAISIGFQKRLEEIDIDDDQVIEALRRELSEVRKSEAYIGVTAGGGRNSVGPFRARISLIESAVDKALESGDGL